MQKNPAEKISSILKTWRDRGLYTHAHALAGSIESPDDTLDLTVCADQARVFDLASLTKALVTAPLVYSVLKGKGADPLRASLGEVLLPWPKGLAESFKSLQVGDILRHRSGLPAWRNFWLGRLGLGLECPPGDPGMAERHRTIVEKFASIPVRAATEPKHLYSDCGYILLGLALEQITGKSLSMLFDGILAGNSDPERNCIHYADRLPAGIPVIPSAFCPLRARLVVGEVHDENCAALGGVCGHAGLFGTAWGVAAVLRRFYEMPVYREFLEINANHLIAKSGHDPDYLLGWRRGSDRAASGFGDGNAMGHLGFTGTAFWVDWPNKRFAILLTNRVISGRVNRAIADVRAEVFSALG
jgi:CubicO group peptidase (beta-lactamase class C family)